MYNFDMAQFYRKWLRDIQSTQSEENGDLPLHLPAAVYRRQRDAGVEQRYHLIVWYAYQYYGDRDLLAEHYDSMRDYVDHLTSIATDYILRWMSIWRLAERKRRWLVAARRTFVHFHRLLLLYGGHPRPCR
jgi:hypothetical protein